MRLSNSEIRDYSVLPSPNLNPSESNINKCLTLSVSLTHMSLSFCFFDFSTFSMHNACDLNKWQDLFLMIITIRKLIAIILPEINGFQRHLHGFLNDANNPW